MSDAPFFVCGGSRRASRSSASSVIMLERIRRRVYSGPAPALMILFLYGEDTYRSKRKLGEIRAKFLRDVDPTGLNLTEIDGEGAGVEEVRSACLTAPFLAPRRLIVLRGALASSKGKQAEDLVEILKSAPEETILTLYEPVGRQDLEKHPAFALLKATKFYPEFAPLDPPSVRSWAVEEAKARGGSFSKPGLEAFMKDAGNDLWKLSSELDALCAYAAARGGAIGPEEVGLLSHRRLEETVFELQDAVGTRRTTRAAELIDSLLEGGETEASLLFRLQGHVRSLLLCSDLAAAGGLTKDRLAGELGLHPFAAAKILSQHRHFDGKELRRLYAWLIEADRKLKTGGWSRPRLALDLFLLELSVPTRQKA